MQVVSSRMCTALVAACAALAHAPLNAPCPGATAQARGFFLWVKRNLRHLVRGSACTAEGDGSM